MHNHQLVWVCKFFNLNVSEYQSFMNQFKPHTLSLHGIRWFHFLFQTFEYFIRQTLETKKKIVGTDFDSLKHFSAFVHFNFPIHLNKHIFLDKSALSWIQNSKLWMHFRHNTVTVFLCSSLEHGELKFQVWIH